jgi:3-hydroxyisobutyrate dehydrogenase-like beta-hydroxyacid dehydrogenase
MAWKTIAVIGAGNGGFNLVAHPEAASHAMRVHDIDDLKLTALRAAASIRHIAEQGFG